MGSLFSSPFDKLVVQKKRDENASTNSFNYTLKDVPTNGNQIFFLQKSMNNIIMYGTPETILLNDQLQMIGSSAVGHQRSNLCRVVGLTDDMHLLFSYSAIHLIDHQEVIHEYSYSLSRPNSVYVQGGNIFLFKEREVFSINIDETIVTKKIQQRMVQNACTDFCLLPDGQQAFLTLSSCIIIGMGQHAKKFNFDIAHTIQSGVVAIEAVGQLIIVTGYSKECTPSDYAFCFDSELNLLDKISTRSSGVSFWYSINSTAIDNNRFLVFLQSETSLDVADLNGHSLSLVGKIILDAIISTLLIIDDRSLLLLQKSMPQSTVRHLQW